MRSTAMLAYGMPLLHFGGLTLDRAEPLRKDVAWVTEQVQHSAAQALLYDKENILVHGGSPLHSMDSLLHTVPMKLLAPMDEMVLLGLRQTEDKAPVFAHRIPPSLSLEDRHLLDAAIHPRQWAPVRQFVVSGSEELVSLIGLGKSLTEWHLHARFCGSCGSRTRNAEGGLYRECLACKDKHFPRINPCAIMLVLDGEGRCLLGKIKGRPTYSTLAGFCSHGESVEETVVREVFEEAGVGVSAVRYFGSQPWPFPFQLMMGFHALADPGKRMIHFAADEVDDVQWFDKSEVREALHGASKRIVVPQSVTISHHLIRAWVEGVVDDFGRRVDITAPRGSL